MGDPGNALVQTAQNFVGPGYFATTGIAMVQGREFTEQDRESTTPVAVISASLARKYFAGQDPVGRYLGDPESKVEIVGIVADVRSRSLREAPAAALAACYLPAMRASRIVPAVTLRAK
jgi:hypothetical protein